MENSRPSVQGGHLDARAETWGRQRELEGLSAELTELERRPGGMRLCLVRGPSGVGKTFLLDLFAGRAQGRGATVLRSGAKGRAGPFGLLSPLVGPLLEISAREGQPSAAVEGLSKRLGPLKGRAVAAAPDGPASDSVTERLEFLDAAAELFLGVGRSRPVVLLLDDLQAADDASLEALHYVLAVAGGPAEVANAFRPAARGRLLVVLAYTDDAPCPPGLERITATLPAASIPLGGLDLEGLRAFLGRRDLAERLLDRTGGIPERVEALLAGSDEGTVESLFRRRLERQPADRRALLQVLALLEEPASVELLSRIAARAGLTVDVAEALGALERARLVTGTPVDGVPLFQLTAQVEAEVLLAPLDEAERQRLHAHVADALEALGAPPPRIAEHRLQAGPGGEGWRAAIEAGSWLERRLACSEAAAFYRRALRALDAPRSREASRIYVRLASLDLARARHASALRWLGLQRACEADEAARRRIGGRIARILVTSMGRPALARRIAEGALGLETGGALPETVGPEAVGLLVTLAEAAWHEGDSDRVLALARLAETAGEAAPLAERIALENTRGKVHLQRGELDQAEAIFEANRRRAEAGGLPEEVGRALNNLGVVAHRRSDRKRALSYYRRALKVGGPVDRRREAFALQNIATLYHETGDFAAALDHYHRALEAFTRAQNRAQVARVAQNLANLYLFLGDFERAGPLCRHALDVAKTVGDPYLVAYARTVQGELARAEGDLPAARRALEEAVDLFGRVGATRQAHHARLALADACLDAGQVQRAARLVEAVAHPAEALEDPAVATRRALLSAAVALARGDLQAAEAALALAKTRLSKTPDLEGPARYHHLSGRLAEARGDRAEAEVHHGRALRHLESLLTGVPVSHRASFMNLRWRKEIADAALGRELSPPAVRGSLSLEPAAARRPRWPERPFPEIVGQDPVLIRTLRLVERLAGGETPVLIRGESGTGKELIAEAIHRRSPRKDGPLVTVNCAAMHEELLLSELFGHEKGAFTGAHAQRKGRFELADGGTLFLDEIGDLSPKAQVALLRALQQKEFQRVGGTRTLKVDVRVVCATNRDLEGMIAAGQFREDLYYRLKGAMVVLPPLRARPGDIPLLVEHFLQKEAAKRGTAPKRVSPVVMSVLTAHRWPGNVRELENVVENLALLAEDEEIRLCDLEPIPEFAPLLEARRETTEPEPDRQVVPTPRDTQSPDFFQLVRERGLSLKELKKEIEEACIARALTEAGGNISEAARLLGMKRSRLSQIVNGSETLRGVLEAVR